MKQDKHTPKVMRAATKAYWYAAKLNDFESHADHKIGVIATIINQETDLPKLQFHIDRLNVEIDIRAKSAIATGNKVHHLEAEKAELVRMLKSAIIDIDDWVDEKGEFDVTHEGLRTLRQELERSLAKSEPPTTTNSKPEEPQ